MISDISTSRFLFWTGIATMLPGLQFVFPVAVLGLLGINIGDAAGMFYARHWGLMALCFGALLVYASRPAVNGRNAIVLAAAIEKLGLVLLVVMAWNEPGMQGLRGAAVFDAVCTLGYVWMLWRTAR